MTAFEAWRLSCSITISLKAGPFGSMDLRPLSRNGTAPLQPITFPVENTPHILENFVAVVRKGCFQERATRNEWCLVDRTAQIVRKIRPIS